MVNLPLLVTTLLVFLIDDLVAATGKPTGFLPTGHPGAAPFDLDARQGGDALRGGLRVYLAAAPGVAERYAVLEEGHRRKAHGTDVEAHGRPKVVELLDGLETLPRASSAKRSLRRV